MPDDHRIHEILEACEGAYASRTLSGYRADLRFFQQWCQQQAHDWLPACPATIADFIDTHITAYRISTNKRRVSAITFANRMWDLPNPADHSVVRLALRRASRTKARRLNQVR